VRLDGAGAEVAAAGIGQSELGAVVQQRPEEHDDRAGPAGSLLVHPLQVECAGGTISRSLESGSHRTLTPIEVSTSMIRLTSSIRARLRSVVRPRLSRVAHSRATAAFLEVLTSMAPESLRPPTIRRCCGRELPRVTNSRSKASPMRASISRDRFCWPCSIRATAL
jgi:hypothetical protein